MSFLAKAAIIGVLFAVPLAPLYPLIQKLETVERAERIVLNSFDATGTLALNSLKTTGQLMSGKWPPVIDGRPLWGPIPEPPPQADISDKQIDGTPIPPNERVFTLQDLAIYTGNPGHPENPDNRVMLAVGGIVFDVTDLGFKFYGPEQGYACFAAKPSSRALALGSTEIEDIELGDSVEDFTEPQMAQLREQVKFYTEKYTRVGVLIERELMVDLGFR